MPRTEFSEFSYGWAVIAEREKALNHAGTPLQRAPRLPSLIEENSVGYDAMLVTVCAALYLQFKVPFYVSQQHSGACRPMHCSWTAVGEPHFRFDIEVGSRQHTLMRDYERQIMQNSLIGTAVYVSPAYYRDQDHHSAYLAGTVWDQSVAVLPSEFDGQSVGPHTYSYVGVAGPGVVMSEPTPAPSSSLQDLVVATVFAGADMEGTSLRSFADNLIASASPVEVSYETETAAGTVRYLRDAAAFLGGAFLLWGYDLNDAPRPEYRA